MYIQKDTESRSFADRTLKDTKITFKILGPSASPILHRPILPAAAGSHRPYDVFPGSGGTHHQMATQYALTHTDDMKASPIAR